MEHYGQLMGLEVLLSTQLTKVDYDESKQTYRVEVESPDGTKTFTPRHVVLATGTFGDKPIIPEFAGQKSFKGKLYHSIEHKSAGLIPDLGNKRVVVIGAGTSAHDIAQDFVSSGAKEVSMVQRHPIFSLSVEAMEALQLTLWNLPELSTEDADLVGNSIPLAVIRTMSIGLTQAMAAFDKDMLDGLKAAGLALRTGEDGYGLADHQLIKGGHFYIDQGANQMIIDGRIKIHRCEGGVKEFHEDGLTLADGKKIEADVVVLATGYHRNISTVEQFLGRDAAEKMPNFGLLDAENERDGVSRSFIASQKSHVRGGALLTHIRLVVAPDWRPGLLVHDREFHVVSAIFRSPRTADCCGREGPQRNPLCYSHQIGSGSRVSSGCSSFPRHNPNVLQHGIAVPEHPIMEVACTLIEIPCRNRHKIGLYHILAMTAV